MISVVVATMWRYPPFLDFLKYVVELNVINEVIIIDNDVERTPENKILDHKKIKLITFGKNIFVNPAWNYGVNLSTSDIVCILNDDLHFDLKLFYKIAEFMKPVTGAIGLSNGRVEYGQTPVTTGTIEFEPFVNQSCMGFGELMFVHKNNWKDIPDGLDLGFGDNFIFDYHHFNGYQNYFITNAFHYHKGNQTLLQFTSEYRQEIYEREKVLYEKIKSELYHTALIKSLKIL